MSKQYHLHIIMNNSAINAKRRVHTVVDQDKLDQVIGRYTRNYGPPLDMESEINGVVEYQFYKRLPTNAIVTVDMLYFAQADETARKSCANYMKVYHPEGADKTKEVVMTKHNPPPPEPLNPKLQRFVDADVLTKVS